MAGYQYTIIIGNVGRDPEMRYTQSGVAVADFSVAVSRRWTDRTSNEQREKTTWFRVSAWRGLAETVNQYVHKGMQVMVTGEVDASAYAGQDGSAARHPGDHRARYSIPGAARRRRRRGVLSQRTGRPAVLMGSRETGRWCGIVE